MPTPPNRSRFKLYLTFGTYVHIRAKSRQKEKMKNEDSPEDEFAEKNGSEMSVQNTHSENELSCSSDSRVNYCSNSNPEAPEKGQINF